MSYQDGWTPKTEAGWKALSQFKKLQHEQEKEVKENKTEKRLEEVHGKPMTHDEYLVKDLTKKIKEIVQDYDSKYVVDALAALMNEALDDLAEKDSKTKMSFIRKLIKGQR